MRKINSKRIPYIFFILMFFISCRLDLFNPGDTRSDAYRRTLILRCLLGQCEIPFNQLLWSEVNRKPTGNQKNGGVFVSDNIGFLVGDYGLILRTSDGGQTWVRLFAGDRDHNIYATDVHPFTKQIFVGGGKSTYDSTYFQYSQDSGRNWKTIVLGANGIVSAIHFTGGSRGFLSLRSINPDKTIFYSSLDNGLTWSKVSEVGFLVSDFKIFEDGGGFAWGIDSANTTSFLFTSKDFATTWQSSSMASGSSTASIGASFLSSNVGYLSLVASGTSTIRKTTDGGNSYSTISIPSNVDTTSALIIDFMDENNGNLLGADNSGNFLQSIYRTFDGGTNWKSTYTDTITTTNTAIGGFIRKSNSDITCIVNSSFGVNLLQTVDTGNTWLNRGTGESPQLGRVTMVSDNVGYTSGGFTSYPKVVLKTIDGGLTWKEKYRSGTGLFRAIYANASGLVWSVGAQRTAVYSTDGGESWNVPISFGAITAASEFRGVSFNSAGIGLLAARVGLNGNISRSTDNGNTWTIVHAISANMIDVKFIDDTNAIAVSGLTSATNFAHQGVYLSSDAGATWTQVPSMAGVSLYDIFILNQNVIYAGSGASGTAVDIAYKSSNKGVSWTKIFEKSAQTVFNTSVAFSDESNGIAAGNSGYWKTNNGGQTWEREYPVTDNGFLGISFLPNKTRVIGTGSSGSIQLRSWP